ncbi:hypothetical protein DPMN_175332 [Dreissena polymorpha]|uniref:Uncharacterized protein n=1 Tax=Dreissena polymorpha TaxID=45954 RepID=A0A9D4IFY3_DREPO|nr:hypothetical protein DPMN_175332 [Dreissena polymorpha]
MMQHTLNDHHTSTSICGKLISNFRFADHIDVMIGTSIEFKDTNILYERAGAYRNEVSTD